MLLDNPIWSALNTSQADLAEGGSLARRFPNDIGPLAGMAEQSADCYRALEELAAGNSVGLFLNSAPRLPPNWSVIVGAMMYQMVLDAPVPVRRAGLPLRSLSAADVPEILALNKLTQPGPFRRRTIELGSYFGIHQAGQLVAMAGERLHLTGYREVSAVCTHPDYRGRGYAEALMSTVIAGILSRGETPMLHTRTENPACQLYRKVGFRVRAELHLAIIKPSYNQE